MSSSMKDNPLLHYYVNIYTLSMVVMLLLKAVRGVVFVKVGFSCVLVPHAPTLPPGQPLSPSDRLCSGP